MRKKTIIALAAVFTGSLLQILIPNLEAKSNKGQHSLRKNMQIFSAIAKELDMNYVDSLDYDRMTSDAIYGFLYNVDPYTEYIKREDQGELKQLSEGKFGGIGSYIAKRGERVIISAPQEGTPSKKAGLRHGDRIIAIDGDTLPKDIAIQDVTKKLQGEPGTTVSIDVIRPYSTDSILKFDIVRDEIKVNSIPYHGMITPNIGYISIESFSGNTAEEFRKALSDLVGAPGIEGLIIDLRNNTGGIVEGAVSSAGNFVPKGTEILRIVYKDKSKKVFRTTRQPLAEKLPLVVLTNGMSASASEILAGSLQDLDRAVIMGERSYGKGLVQISRPLPDDGLLKVTIGKYYIPSGRLVQAINYGDRDANGNVKRIPDSLTKVFKTLVGREVRDGGGITPDSIVMDETPSRLLYTLVTEDWIYDFANKYRSQHETMPGEKNFKNDSLLFGEFKKFIVPEKLKYDRLTEKSLEYLRNAVKEEGYQGEEIEFHLAALDSLLKHNLDRDLNLNRDKIMEYLEVEITKRYYPESEAIRRGLKSDKQVLEAVGLLKNKEAYQKLLSPKTK